VRLVFADAAERLKAAALAGLRVFARIDLGAADEVVARQLFDGLPPCIQLLGGERVGFQSLPWREIGSQRGCCVAYPASELQISSADFGEDQSAEGFLAAVEGESGVERQLHVVRTRQIPGFE